MSHVVIIIQRSTAANATESETVSEVRYTPPHSMNNEQIGKKVKRILNNLDDIDTEPTND